MTTDDLEIERVLTEEDVEDIVEMLPENRIATYHEALNEYERALLPHLSQSKVWGRIDKLFSGVPPFNPKKLKELGQHHMVNTDFGDARSKLQKAITAYYNIFYKNKFLAEINVEFTDGLLGQFPKESVGNIESSTTREWSQIITEEWTRSKRKDWNKKFFNFISVHLRQLMLYGVNHIFFPTKNDPIPESGTIYAHYSTMDSKTDVTKNDIHIVKHDYSVFELLNFFVKDKTGLWNKDALSDVLMEALEDLDHGEDDAYSRDDLVSYVEHLIKRIRNHELNTNQFYNTKIEVASLFVKEFEVDGKKEGVTHLIFTPHVTASAPLFFSDRAYDTLDEVLLVSTLLPGIEEIHEAKGLGHISYGHILELTKMKCNFATNIKLSGTTFFSTDSSSQNDVKKLTVPIGGIGVVDDSFKLVHANTNLAAQNILAGVQYLENDLDKNSMFVLNPASSDDAPVGTVQKRAKEAVEMQQNNLIHYSLSTLNELYATIFRKELQYGKKKTEGGKLAKRFIERCVNRGVPKEIFEYKDIDPITKLPSWFSVSAYKSAGTGSQIGDSLQIQEAYQFGIPQKLKSRGGQYFREMEAAAIFGQDIAEKLYPPEDVADDPTYMSTMASLVANDLEEGKAVQFSPDLDHETFASVLLQRMQEVANAYLEQPPTGIEEFKEQERELLFKTDIALQGLGNFLGLSLTYLAEDPGKQALFKNILPLFNRLEGLAQGIHANAEKARDAVARDRAQQQAQNNAAMQKVIFDRERKMFEAQTDRLVKTFKARGSFNLDLIESQERRNLDRIQAVSEAQARIIKARGEAAQQNSVDR